MNFQKIFFTILLFLSVSAASATDKGQLQGLITDAITHKPLSNATLYITDLKRWAITNKDGYYSYDDLPNGTFTVEVTFIGYISYVGTVTVSGTTNFNISLKSSVVENENVTVTGVSAATQLKKSPLQVSIISKKQLDRSSGNNLLDAIANQPGVSIVTTGPAIAKPFIRGLGYNRVATINDGVRQEGQQWGDEHGIEIDEYSAQKIEILRGPASLMYGSDAIGGVLNVMTNVPVTANTIKANLQGNMNSNNKLAGGYAGVSGNIDNFNWNVYSSLKIAGDYKNKYDGNVLNSRFSEKNFGGYAGINKSWGYSHIIFSNFDQHIGIVEGERNENGNFILEGYTLTDALQYSKKPLVPYQRVRHLKIAFDNSFSLGNAGRITALIGFQQNQRQEFANAESYRIANAWFDLKTVNYNIVYHLPQTKGWKTSFGINGMQQKNSNRADETIIPDYHLFDVGIYAYSSKTMNRTTISGGLRYDTRFLNSRERGNVLGEIKFQAFKKQFSNFSASLGLAHELSDIISLKANVSRGFRAPSAPELSANGEHEGTNRYEIGNNNLKSETSFSADGSIEITTQHISLNVAPFFNHISDYIYYEKILSNNGADSLINGTPAFRFTQQSANLTGLDINFDIHPHPLDWLHFENTFSLVNGRFTKAVDGSDNLPLIAPARLLTELRAEFPQASNHLKNLYIKFEMDNTASQNKFYAGYNTETATKGYTLLNAGAGSDLIVSNKKILTFHFSINNITDIAYQSHLNRLKYLAVNETTGRTGVFNMGRNFTAKIIVPFEWKVK